MSREPKWFADAACLLAEGRNVAETARAVGCSREALSRRLNAPGSTLKAEVDRRGAALAADTADKTKTVVDRALAVLERGLSSTDDRRALDSAKVLLGKLLPSQQVVKVEESPAAPISAEDAVRELAGALVTAADLIAEGGVSSGTIALLAEAAGRFVAVLPPVVRRETDAALSVPPKNGEALASATVGLAPAGCNG
jgi:hypothetical protein